MPSPCAAHGHPHLSRPATPSTFTADVARIDKGHEVFGAQVWLVDDIHGSGTRERRYAQVRFTKRGVRAEFDRAILWLPRPQRLGLILHEFGHALLGPTRHTEEEADEMACLVTDFTIYYDRRWPGKGLQTMAMRMRKGGGDA